MSFGLTTTLSVALSATFSLAACQSDDKVVNVAAQLQAFSYEKTIMAPDACYVISPTAERVAQGTELVIRRTLSREDGICAQALTPVVVAGRVTDAGAFQYVVLEIVDEAGAVLHSFPIP